MNFPQKFSNNSDQFKTRKFKTINMYSRFNLQISSSNTLGTVNFTDKFFEDFTPKKNYLGFACHFQV